MFISISKNNTAMIVMDFILLQEMKMIDIYLAAVAHQLIGNLKLCFQFSVFSFQLFSSINKRGVLSLSVYSSIFPHHSRPLYILAYG